MKRLHDSIRPTPARAATLPPLGSAGILPARSQPRRDPRALVLCLAALSIAPATALAQQTPQQDVAAIPALLSPAQAPARAVALPQARSFVAAHVDTAVLASATPESLFTLDVAPGRTLTAVVRKIERRFDGSYSVFGAIEGLANSTFIIVVQDGVAAADILAPSHGMHYRFKYAGDGVHLVCDVDDGSFAPCGGAVRPPPNLPDEDFVPEAVEPDEAAKNAEPPPSGPTPRGVCGAPETVFDAMVVYTDVARTAMGGTAAIEAEIQLAVDRTNEAYTNSPIFARYRLVWREEVAYDEVGTYGDHLGRLSSSSTAPWPGIRSLRDSVNADFCTMWVDDQEFCGLAHCTASNSSAYSVVTWSCAAGNLSHPHEVGHNQGCDHDPNNGGGCGAFSYSFGHRFFGSDSVEYRTVMSYAPGTRIPFFSNPSQTFMATATGTVSRDNCRTVNDRRGTCEAFQVSRYDIWVQFSFGGSESGTFSNPYNTMTEGVNNLDFPGLGASELPILHIKEGTTTWTGTINKGMRISPCGGTVRIGG